MSFDIDIARRVGDGDVSIQFVAADGLTILFGPSGVGKTSVLNMVAGLIKPERGHIRVGDVTLFDAATGIDMPSELRCAGYVFQEARLFPHMQVGANLLYGRRKIPTVHQVGFGGASVALAFDDVVDFLGIGNLLDRWPRSLSGGEARRVAIGRALLSDPAFLLLDEPLSSLDRPRREEIMRAIEHIRDVLKLPILMVTHDAAEAERLGTRIIAM